MAGAKKPKAEKPKAEKPNTDGGGVDTPAAQAQAEAPFDAPEPTTSEPAIAAGSDGAEPLEPPNGDNSVSQAPEPPDGAPAPEGAPPPDGGKPEPGPTPEPQPTSVTIVPLADLAFAWGGVLVQLRKDVPAVLEPAQVRDLEGMGAPFTRKT